MPYSWRVPFYAFGAIDIVTTQNLDSLGPTEGKAVAVSVPISDLFRSVYLWFVLFGLLMRRSNRNRSAWIILFPLLVIYIILHIAESWLNSYFIFHLHMYICSLICELLRFFAVSLAILLSVSDLITIQNRSLRFFLVFLIIFFAGALAINFSEPVILNVIVLTTMFGILLLIFMVSRSVISVLLRKFFSYHQLTLYAVVCFVLGFCPILILGIIEVILSRSVQLQSTQVIFRNAIIISQAISAPYIVFLWFVLLALFSPFYRRRFAQSFGLTTQQDLIPL